MKGEMIPEFRGWGDVIPKLLVRVREEDVMMDTQVRERGQGEREPGRCHAPGFEGTTGQGMQAVARKPDNVRKRIGPRSLPQSCGRLDFSPLRPISDFSAVVG